MADPAFEKTYFTAADYFAYEEHSDFRHEFYQGELFRMDATTMRHNRMIDRIKDVLRAFYDPKGCMVVSESIRLEALRNEYYPYPDIMVSCHGFDRELDSTLRNPSLIVEVLSLSTESNDRGLKWQHYKNIASLEHYLLVSQYECLCELYTRTEQDGLWLYQAFDQLTDVIDFQRLGFQLPLAKVYDGISFEPENTTPEPSPQPPPKEGAF